jgi:hypothetical protein
MSGLIVASLRLSTPIFNCHIMKYKVYLAVELVAESGRVMMGSRGWTYQFFTGYFGKEHDH